MNNSSERLRILDLIESGKITAAEGLRLLEALASEEVDDSSDAQALPGMGQRAGAGINLKADQVLADGNGASEGASSVAQPPELFRAVPVDEPVGGGPDPETNVPPVEAQRIPPELRRWRNFWMIPLWIGVVITVLGALLLNSILQASGVSFWFFCGSIPFLFGLLVLVVAWWSRTARWLHLRIDQKPGDKPQRIALSFPLPIALTTWILRTFGDRIPGLQKSSVDEVLMAVGKTTNPDNPLFIDVNEGEDGERVRIYIG